MDAEELERRVQAELERERAAMEADIRQRLTGMAGAEAPPSDGGVADAALRGAKAGQAVVNQHLSAQLSLIDARLALEREHARYQQQLTAAHDGRLRELAGTTEAMRHLLAALRGRAPDARQAELGARLLDSAERALESVAYEAECRYCRECGVVDEEGTRCTVAGLGGPDVGGIGL